MEKGKFLEVLKGRQFLENTILSYIDINIGNIRKIKYMPMKQRYAYPIIFNELQTYRIQMVHSLCHIVKLYLTNTIINYYYFLFY